MLDDLTLGVWEAMIGRYIRGSRLDWIKGLDFQSILEYSSAFGR
jgi:hypothetical protein